MTAGLHDYLRQFASMARNRRMPGERIGEAIAEVETHIADTAEDPREAFGDPQAYATQLASDGPRLSPPSYARCFWSFLGFITGSFLLLGALRVATSGGVLQFGWALVLPLVVSVIAALVLASGYRRDPRGSLWVFLLLLVVASVLQTQEFWGSGPTVPLRVAIPVGVVLAVLSVAVWWWALPRTGRIIDPPGNDRTSLGRPTTGAVVGNIVVTGVLVGIAVAHSGFDMLAA